MQKIATEYFGLAKEKRRLEAELKVVKERMDALEKELIIMMENKNLQSFRDATHGLIYLDHRVHASIKDTDAAFKYFRDNDMGDIIKETINNKTLCAVMKDELEKNNSDIPGIDAYIETTIKYRSA